MLSSLQIGMLAKCWENNHRLKLKSITALNLPACQLARWTSQTGSDGAELKHELMEKRMNKIAKLHLKLDLRLFKFRSLLKTEDKVFYCLKYILQFDIYFHSRCLHENGWSYKKEKKEKKRKTINLEAWIRLKFHLTCNKSFRVLILSWLDVRVQYEIIVIYLPWSMTNWK